MKKKMAIVLSLVLACSMSMTAAAAPSPSLIKTPGTQVVVDSSAVNVATGSAAAATTTSVSSSTSAVMEGTTFKNAAGQAIDPAAVALVVAPATAEQTAAAVQSFTAALTSAKASIVNFTGRQDISLTDAQGRIRVLGASVVALQTADGQAVSQNGSISVNKTLAEILGTTTLAAGETVQALYQRADGTWVAVPVVINNGVVAFALPSFAGAVNVVFTVAAGTSVSELAPVTSPNT